MFPTSTGVHRGADSPLSEHSNPPESVGASRLIHETRDFGAALQRAAEIASSDPSRAVLLLHTLKEHFRVRVEPVLNSLVGGSPGFAHITVTGATTTPGALHLESTGDQLPIFAVPPRGQGAHLTAADPSLAFATTSIDFASGADDHDLAAAVEGNILVHTTARHED